MRTHCTRATPHPTRTRGRLRELAWGGGGGLQVDEGSVRLYFPNSLGKINT